MPKGSLVIADSSCIHRGEPTSSSIRRQSIIFQIDASTEYCDELVLNSSFIDKPDSELFHKNSNNFSGYFESSMAQFEEMPFSLQARMTSWFKMTLLFQPPVLAPPICMRTQTLAT